MHESMKRLYEAALALKGAATPTEVAKLLDETSQVLNNWERRGISKGGLLKAQEAIGCRAEWLKRGSGPMTAFATYPKTAGGDPATHSDADSSDSLSLTKRIHTRRLPLIGWAQVGDIGVSPMEDIEIQAFMDSPYAAEPTDFLVQLATESMLPDFRPGEVIQVRMTATPKHNDDVVVVFPSGKSTFRRLLDTEDGRILQALNPQWPDRLLSFPPGTRIVGVVVASWMDRRRA